MAIFEIIHFIYGYLLSNAVYSYTSYVQIIIYKNSKQILFKQKTISKNYLLQRLKFRKAAEIT